MKILQLSYGYYPDVGGGYRYMKEIVDHFRAKGHVVDVLTVSRDKDMHVESDARGSIIRLPRSTKIHSVAISRPYIYLFGKLAGHYDILHFNFPSPMAEVAAIHHAKKLTDARNIVLYHADIVPSKRFSGLYNRFITSRFLKLMDHIVVSSPKLAESSEHLKLFRDKVHVIPFGVPLDSYRPGRLHHSRTSQPPQPTLNILFVGRLDRYKGVDYLIRAMGSAPGRLSIIGEGPAKESWARLADELNLARRITFHGFVPEQQLLRSYQEADILVLPSTDAGEAFGYVLIEAMGCRTALITTELGTGTSYVNLDGDTGFVVPSNDTDALAGAIRRLAERPDLLTRFKDNALKRAHEQFSLDRMLSETEKLFLETGPATGRLT